MQVKCDELGRLQKENGDRLEAAAAEEGPDITTIANARAEATFKADLHVETGHEPKSSEKMVRVGREADGVK
jgi:hypothetical protein